jgi:hypothetical protein
MCIRFAQFARDAKPEKNASRQILPNPLMDGKILPMCLAKGGSAAWMRPA